MEVEFNVGDQFTVVWSNGAGESVYKIIDDPGTGSHLFSLVSEKEYT